MVSSNASALGVIFANTYDNLVPELVAERTMASIPFGGRYRMIDFVLSNMANSGIDNVSVIVRKNYHSLMDHLGAGREWDLTRKRTGQHPVLDQRPEGKICHPVRRLHRHELRLQQADRRACQERC